jgi:hypothetical protein
MASSRSREAGTSSSEMSGVTCHLARGLTLSLEFLQCRETQACRRKNVFHLGSGSQLAIPRYSGKGLYLGVCWYPMFIAQEVHVDGLYAVL